MKFVLKYKNSHHYTLTLKRTEKIISSFYDMDGLYTTVTNIRILKRFGNEN